MRSALAAVVLLAACGPVKEREPNDDFAHATPLAAGRAGSGTLASPADQDWFRVRAKQEGVLSVRLTGIREADWVLSVRAAADRLELKRVDDTSVGGDEQALDVWLPGGEAFVVVANKNARASNAAQAYGLETSFAPAPGREREPNDRATSSAELVPGTPLAGHFHPGANPLAEDGLEEDWFRVVVDKPGLQILNIDLSDVPKVDAALEVYDANGYKVREADAGGVGEAESLRNFGVRGPAEYKLRLRAKGRAANAEVPYLLVTELVPYQGRLEFEPNEQRSEATPFEGDSISGTLAPAGDADWYRIIVATDSRQLIRAEVSAAAGLDLVLQVADELGSPILTVDNMGREQPEVLTGLGARAEQYLIVTEKSGKKADAKRPYTLSRTLVAWQEGLEYEVNAATSSAQAVKLGDDVEGYFAPRGDVDWYEFNVYQKGSAALELTGVVNVKATLALFDQENNALKSAEAQKAGTALTLEAELEPGTYFARLAPADPAQSNVRDKYAFRVRMR
ncbi:MAG: pre-peptidase C-terminal domain-containing protein [Elusimicrobia bacterium]|nr:pre-peptidase C-terminal domain-containing protein [Elusimicrobiota bacterium]